MNIKPSKKTIIILLLVGALVLAFLLWRMKYLILAMGAKTTMPDWIALALFCGISAFLFGQFILFIIPKFRRK